MKVEEIPLALAKNRLVSLPPQRARPKGDFLSGPVNWATAPGPRHCKRDSAGIMFNRLLPVLVTPHWLSNLSPAAMESEPFRSPTFFETRFSTRPPVLTVLLSNAAAVTS